MNATKPNRSERYIGRATGATKPLRNAEIDAHPLLTHEERATLKIMRNKRRDITMYDFAKIVHQAAATDYANVDRRTDGDRWLVRRALQRAALLYVYEALKACDHDIIKQWAEFDTMLQQLEDLDTLGYPL